MSSARKQPATWGVTKPLSLQGPTAQDERLTELLVRVLKEADFFETEEEGERREIVLGRLSRLVNDFVQTVARHKGYPESVVRDIRGKIFTFGSYRLGVHAKGADIDTLCVVPQAVDRHDFFTVLPELLRRERDITDVTPVPDAYVPVLQMCVAGISIDLVVARLPLASITDAVDLLDVNILKGLDEKDILSLNGSRTTDEILRLVPCPAVFHTALRAIKLWAQRRGLYNNAMGYIAGVACALLTARICQLFPNAAASVILHRFFHVYKQWQWPQPVYLKDIEEYSSASAAPRDAFLASMKVWNPRLNAVDRSHRMPLITPAFPSMCATHNVSHSTLRFMTAEFERGYQICSRLYPTSTATGGASTAASTIGASTIGASTSGTSTSNAFTSAASTTSGTTASNATIPLSSPPTKTVADDDDKESKRLKTSTNGATPHGEEEERWMDVWRELLAPTDFFLKFRHFIQVIAISHPAIAASSSADGGEEREAQSTSDSDADRDSPKALSEDPQERHRRWSGFVEAKLRWLTQKLEVEPGVAWAPPHFRAFDVDVQASLENVLLSHVYSPTHAPIGVAATAAATKDASSDGAVDKQECTQGEFDQKPDATQDDRIDDGDKPVEKADGYRSTAFYVAIGVQRRDEAPSAGNAAGGVRRLMLERPISEFRQFLQAWEHFRPDDLQLVVRDIKREQLPAYIFPPDQRPPARKPQQ